jgi:hypothetical protein
MCKSMGIPSVRFFPDFLLGLNLIASRSFVVVVVVVLNLVALRSFVLSLIR